MYTTNIPERKQMYTTRRSGFDRDDARQHYAQLQTRKLTKLPRVGDKVVMNDNVDAQVYTVVEAYSSSCNTRIMVQLKYINDSGKVCRCGAVDSSILLQPSEQQLNRS
jgi:hypothetical protein